MTSTPASTPALQPPPGLISNFNDPWSIGGAVAGFVVFSLIVTTLTTVGRITTRLYIMSSFKVDDYLMTFAWLIFIPYSTLMLLCVHYGAGKHQWDVTLANFQLNSYYALVLTFCYPITLAAIKISICLQVIRIFIAQRGRDYWLAWTFLIIQMIWFSQWFIMVAIHCSGGKESNVPTLERCLGSNQSYMIGLSTFNLVSDLLILAFPLFSIASLQLKTRKKLPAFGVFIIGIVAVIASALRIVYSVRNDATNDHNLTLFQVAACSYAEMAAGIVAGNVVSLPKLFVAVKPKVQSLASSFSHQWSPMKLSTSSTNHTPLSDLPDPPPPASRGTPNAKTMSLEMTENEFV